MKNNKKYFRSLLSTCTAILAILLLTTCFSPLGNEKDDDEWNDGKTRIVITLPGGNSNARNLMGSPSRMTYVLTFNGPGGPIVEECVGGDTIAVEVEPGLWSVDVKLHDTVSSAPVEAKGGILNFTVKAGAANKPRIQMRFVRVSPMIDEYLGTASASVISLHLNMQLTDTDWNNLLGKIGIAGKFVALNLNFCTRSGVASGAGFRSDGTFDPNPANPSGKNRITLLILPEGVTSIVNNAFDNCTSLAAIMIPNSVNTIDNNAFNACSNLIRVFYGGANNTAWSAISIGGTNTPLNSAYRLYYSVTDPGTVGTHWRYVDWMPQYWGGAPTFTITMQDDGNGTATAAPTSASDGMLVTLNAMPNIGYRFKEWQVVSGAVVLLPDMLTSPATFTMPASPVIIRAVFEAVPAGMVWVPAGTFLMGSLATELGRYSDETQHSVTLTSGFYIGRYPVTQDEYQAVMGYNPSNFTTPAGDDPSKRPVEMVTWYDAIEFCIKLSVLEGLDPVYTITIRTPPTGYPITLATFTSDFSKNGYRLPTEAQWEYACRAGRGEAFNWGTNTINDTRANYRADNMDANNPVAGTYLGRTTEVGTYAANAWGLYDMHGNVLEWCWDWNGDYSNSFDTRSNAAAVGDEDPAGAISGAFRVDRGGSWFSNGREARSAFRDFRSPNNGYNDMGFRVVRP